MRHILFTGVILFFLLPLVSKQILAQQNCTFKPPVVKIDFGSGDIPDLNTYLSKYERDFSKCPNDGFYSYASSTSNCFNGDWFTIHQDHTGEGKNGNMMLVNASETGGVFFNTNMNGFTGNTTYQLTLCIMNVCRVNGGCAPLPPDITINIAAPDDRKISVFKTRPLAQGNVPRWRQLTGFFKTPPGTTSLKLTMVNNTLGGCGNDFAMDDIIIRECVTPKPEVKKQPVSVVPKPVIHEPPVKKAMPVVEAPAIKKVPVIIQQVKKDTVVAGTPVRINQAKGDTTVTATSMPFSKSIVEPVIKKSPVIKLPEPIAARANPVVKQIEAEAGEMLVKLYDNGEIDGDTVTIYHNNQMIVSKAALSANAVSFRVKVDKTQPHHELVMVADNLGSIPPNTSIMIIIANDKRYEVFISSSEQKNAKVLIDLKE